MVSTGAVITFALNCKEHGRMHVAASNRGIMDMLKINTFTIDNYQIKPLGTCSGENMYRRMYAKEQLIERTPRRTVAFGSTDPRELPFL